MSAYLGQGLIYRPKYPVGEPQAVIYLGKNPKKDHQFLDEDGEIIMPAPLDAELLFVRQEDKTSPSGASIYFGETCRFITGDFKIKAPEKEAADKVFKTINKLLQNKELNTIN